VVATHQLPRNESTLWLRLLGRGPTQRAAIEDLLQLDASHPQRQIAIEQLRQWHDLLSTGQMGRESPRLMALLARL
jgi:Spy/CpxP family protein refolding chaperone